MCGATANINENGTQKARQVMSEVYIRSQNREGLYVLNNYHGIKYSTGNDSPYIFIKKNDEKQEEEHYIFLQSNNGDMQKLGEYESKERCIEVLDEIEKVCRQYLYAPGSRGLIVGSEATPPMAAVIPRLYQMPEN